MTKQFAHSILGGTFDHLHAGHKFFIESSFEHADQVTIGLTADFFSQNKPFAYSIEKYDVRKKALEDFLSKKGVKDKAVITKINDPYGASIVDTTIDAIFVTAHGLSNAKIINHKRQKAGLSKLAINKVTFLKGSDRKTISSTRIRKGEIDRMGNPYVTIFDKTLHLPGNLRGEVKNTPSGDLLRSSVELKKFVKNAHFIVSIGDTTSANLGSIGHPPNIGIIDLKIKRKPITENNIKADFEAKNAPGVINHEAVLALNESFEHALSESKQILKIVGEEDLLTLPALLLSPLESRIIYGSPDKGAIGVITTEEKKEEVKNLLYKFDI